MQVLRWAAYIGHDAGFDAASASLPRWPEPLPTTMPSPVMARLLWGVVHALHAERSSLVAHTLSSATPDAHGSSEPSADAVVAAAMSACVNGRLTMPVLERPLVSALVTCVSTGCTRAFVACLAMLGRGCWRGPLEAADTSHGAPIARWAELGGRCSRSEVALLSCGLGSATTSASQVRE